MTQSTTTNGYSISFMDSTDVYNYLKRIARKASSVLRRDSLNNLAEAIINCYEDDTAIDTVELKQILISPERMSTMDYREMECHVTTSVRRLAFSEAHVD